MVKIMEVATNQSPQRRNQNSTGNANRNTNRAVLPKSRQVKVTREVNSDVENDEFQIAHKFENGQIIMKLVAWGKKPSLEHDLSGILMKYRKTITDNPNFIEAALILQSSADLYAKRVELLFKSIMQSQLRIVKSFNIINAVELHKIEKKMRKRKLTQIDDEQHKAKRHKKGSHWLKRPVITNLIKDICEIFKKPLTDIPKEASSSDFLTIDPKSAQNMENALKAVAKWGDPEFLQAEHEKYLKEYEARFIPLDEYIYRPYFEKSEFVAYETPEKDQTVRWENLLMAEHDFYHDKKYKWYEVYFNKKDPKTMMDVTVWEDAVYNHRLANPEATSLCDLLINYDKYDNTACEKFLMEHLKEEHDAQIAGETLDDKNKRMCPYSLNVKINRLDDDLLQNHLNKQQAEHSQENHLPNNSETPAETNPETQTNVSGLIQIENPVTEIANDSLNAVENNDSIVEEIASSALALEHDKPVLADVVQKEIRKLTVTLRERKLKKPETEDELESDEEMVEELPIKKKRYQLEKPTTCDLMDYERFFCNNYQPEEGEGVVVPLPPLAPKQPNPPNTTDLTTPDSDEQFTASETHIPRIPRLPTGEIITPEMRRFMDIQARIAETREDNRWYYDWESMIKDRLKIQHCSKFDIHEYGTRIVRSFPEDEPNKTLAFKDMVKDQPKHEVIRNFVATLHLATSMNLELFGTNPGKLCNDTLGFKLLNRELHHETLMGYEAPSELKLKANGRTKRKVHHQDIKSAKKQVVLNNLLQVQERLTKDFNPKVVLTNILTPRHNNNITPETSRKSVSFESESNSEIRCTTTIVKTPSRFNYNEPIATSTPSPRSNHLRSCDSGFCTDGSLTPGASPPNCMLGRATIEEDGFDMSMGAGPSTDYAMSYPAGFEVMNARAVCRQEIERSKCRKRQLDFGDGCRRVNDYFPDGEEVM